MSATQAPGTVLDRSDADLIDAVRAGDLESYGELFARHQDSARRLALQLTRGSGDAEDLVSDAFAKVMEVLERGGGPDEAFRAYLLTSVRRLYVDRTRVTSRVQATDDIAAYDAGVPFHDSAVAGFDNEAAAEAFASLPERWQLVLWHTEVEGAKPADVAPLLGISPNSVAALAYRAREGLREAFLAAHATRTEDPDCRRTQSMLGGYVRGNSSRRDSTKVEDHLEGCRRCTGIYLELAEVNSGMGALLAPLLLGGAAAGYVGSGALAATTATTAGLGWGGWLLALPGRARDLALANLPATAAAGVATAVVGG
uniref:sigma-70 family RNA polymerase sigma factor n=1 Tax=Nocardioides sp. REDSEA-S30_B4 TaxID=1811552 RepID=UPI000A97B49F